MVAILFLLVGVVAGATASLRVSLRLLELSQLAGFGVHVGVGGALGGGEGGKEGGEFVNGNGVGEGDLEHDEEVAVLERLLVERQAFFSDRLQVVGLDHLAGLVSDSDFGAIEVRDHEVDAGEGFDQSDFVFDQQISALALEPLVGLLLHNDNDVASFLARVLVGLSVEGVLGVVRRTLVDLSINNLLLLVHLLALAGRALVRFVDDLSLAAAVVTGTLRLRVHARAELGHARHHTATAAGRALLDSAFFAAEAIARLADALSVHCNLGGLASVNFLKSALEWVHHGLALLGARRSTTGSAAAAEEAAKQVVHAVGVATTAVLDAIFTVLVVKLALLAVAEDLVGTLDLLELVLITTAIGMVSPGQLEVRLLDGLEVCVFVDAQNFVELGVVDLLGRAAASRHATHLLCRRSQS